MRSASSMSASSKMTAGFLPPSSRLIFLNLGATCPAMRAPVTVPPVKDTAAMSGWVTMASPTSGPNPCKMLKTPSGNPASLIHVLNRYAVTGVNSEGLATTQFPAAKAGATFQVNRYNGKFQGLMHATTPSGLRRV